MTPFDTLKIKRVSFFREKLIYSAIKKEDGTFGGVDPSLVTDYNAKINTDKFYITPTWTTAIANSYGYGIYWPKPWSDNLYLANTEKLWTDEYTKFAGDTEFKNIVGDGNVCKETTEDGIINYYNLTAGLVLNYDKTLGTMKVKFKNNGTKSLKLYIMKKPLSVTTGYVKNDIIVTNKSNVSSKNEIVIAAGATEEVTFEKEQKLILFSFHGVDGSATAPGILEVQSMQIKFKG